MSANNQPPPLLPEGHWYYVKDGARQGPITMGTLTTLFSDNTIDAETLVWRAGWRDWKPIRETELDGIVSSVLSKSESTGEPQTYQMDDEYEGREGDIPATKERMIDWVQCCKLPVMFSAIGLLILNYAFQKLTIEKKSLSAFFPTTALDGLIYFLAAAYILVGPVAFVSQLAGVKFDAARDSLSYPLYVLRRTIRLSEIHDANSQTTTKQAFLMSNTLLGLFAGRKFSKSQTGTTKRYFVNLSGDFGSRRIVFHTKSKRDQFLSLLRNFAPQCRITRWY